MAIYFFISKNVYKSIKNNALKDRIVLQTLQKTFRWHFEIDNSKSSPSTQHLRVSISFKWKLSFLTKGILHIENKVKWMPFKVFDKIHKSNVSFTRITSQKATMKC